MQIKLSYRIARWLNILSLNKTPNCQVMKSIVKLLISKVTIINFQWITYIQNMFFCKIGEFPTWKWGGCVTKKKIILTFSDISDMNEKIIFMYAGLQLTSFRCSWGFWKYIRCLMPKYNIKGNFSFQMWSYYIAWWPYMNKPLKNSYKNGSHIMH